MVSMNGRSLKVIQGGCGRLIGTKQLLMYLFEYSFCLAIFDWPAILLKLDRIASG